MRLNKKARQKMYESQESWMQKQTEKIITVTMKDNFRQTEKIITVTMKDNFKCFMRYS